MAIDELKNKVEQYNPLARHRRLKMQSELKNRNITFLTPNCLGGILFHDLGLQFMSPTVNLMMTQSEFVKFVLNLDEYLSKELVFFKSDKYSCPCAMLGDIFIVFTHYLSEKDAEIKWKERSKRINKDNLFVFCEERDGILESEIRSLGKLSIRGLVVFTAKKYKDIPYALHIPKYSTEEEVGNILARKSYLNGSREYERYFDFVKWFNEANGGDYDISNYSKI